MTQKDVINFHELVYKFQDTYFFLRKKWIIIVLFTLFGVGLGLYYAITRKPKFEASLSFVIEGESGGNGLANLANTFGLGRTGGAGQSVFTSANILDLLKTRKLVEKTLLQPSHFDINKSFADLVIDFMGLKEEWGENPKLKNIQFKPNSNPKKLSLNQNEVLQNLHSVIVLNNLKVEIKNPDNTIIYIDVKSENEEFTRYFPEELIKVVSEYYIEAKTRKAKENYLVLKRQTDSVRVELNNAISGVAYANDNTFLLNPAFNVKRVPSAHKEVSVQANQAILTELVKNLEISRMNLLNETPFIEIIDTPTSPINPMKIGKFKGMFLGGIIGVFLIISILIGLNFIMNFIRNIPKREINN